MCHQWKSSLVLCVLDRFISSAESHTLSDRRYPRRYQEGVLLAQVFRMLFNTAESQDTVVGHRKEGGVYRYNKEFEFMICHPLFGREIS